MSIKTAVIRLISVSVLCIAFFAILSVEILFGAFAKTFSEEKNVTSMNQLQEIYEPLPEKSDTYTDSSPSSSAVQSSESKAEENTSSVAVNTSEKALGKITERFITPYTANTSYGKVYLKNSTGLTIDIKSLLSASLPYAIKKNSEPQVLIVHTHTTESFMLTDKPTYSSLDVSRRKNSKQNMVALGAKITEVLNKAGIKTVHDTTIHDYPEYNGSYTRSAETVKKQLKAHPSIKVVIDLHRDAIAGDGTDKVKPVVEINGKKAAQVMLVMGSQSGSVKNHADWKENLKLAVRLQKQFETDYPTLARSVSLMSRLYNQNLSKGAILLEIGTEANTLDEALYSAELVGNSLVKTLSEIK